MRVDASFECSGALYRKGDFQVATIVLRSERTGHTSPHDVRRISTMFPAMSSAVRLHLHLENQGTLAAAGALEALSLSAIFCDAWNNVIACSEAAEKILKDERRLRVRGGRIEAADPAANGRLQAVLGQANSPDAISRMGASDFAVPLGADGVSVRVAPLPRSNNTFGCGAS